jgi:hypothetical protein
MGLCLSRETEIETPKKKPVLEHGEAYDNFPLGIDIDEVNKNYRMRPTDMDELDEFIKRHKHKHKH